jgi:peptide/nickel transport system permease protein
MQTYILKRVLLFIPTLLVVSLLVFFLMRVIPGDPALFQMHSSLAFSRVTEKQIEAKRKELGTDRHIAVQYGSWLGGMARGDFGTSMYLNEPVSDTLSARLPVTLQLTVMAQFIALAFALPFGVFSAMKQDTWGDYAARIVTMFGVGIPTFYVAILTIYFLVIVFGWSPPLKYAELWEDPRLNFQQLIFPALALGFYTMAITARMTRSAMLEVIREDYIRTARSKGLRERPVIVRHALKNAALPVLTIFGWQFAAMMAGSITTEAVFRVPGLGRSLIDAIYHRDYIMIQGLIMVVAFMIMLTNLMVDIIYAWVDPRIRYS